MPQTHVSNNQGFHYARFRVNPRLGANPRASSDAHVSSPANRSSLAGPNLDAAAYGANRLRRVGASRQRQSRERRRKLDLARAGARTPLVRRSKQADAPHARGSGVQLWGHRCEGARSVRTPPRRRPRCPQKAGARRAARNHNKQRNGNSPARAALLTQSGRKLPAPGGWLGDCLVGELWWRDARQAVGTTAHAAWTPARFSMLP